MCERCEELEERVAWLESELGLRVYADEINALVKRLGLPPGVAHVVRALHGGHGRTVTHLQLLDAIPSPERREDRSLTNVGTLICRARKKLGPDAIESVWGHGYKLTAAGMAKVGAVLSAEPMARAA